MHVVPPFPPLYCVSKFCLAVSYIHSVCMCVTVYVSQFPGVVGSSLYRTYLPTCCFHHFLLTGGTYSHRDISQSFGHPHIRITNQVMSAGAAGTMRSTAARHATPSVRSLRRRVPSENLASPKYDLAERPKFENLFTFDQRIANYVLPLRAQPSNRWSSNFWPQEATALIENRVETTALFCVFSAEECLAGNLIAVFAITASRVTPTPRRCSRCAGRRVSTMAGTRRSTFEEANQNNGTVTRHLRHSEQPADSTASPLCLDVSAKLASRLLTTQYFLHYWTLTFYKKIKYA